MEAMEQGLHVLVAKPFVKTVEEHLALTHKAREKNVIAAMEVHKRWDPLYTSMPAIAFGRWVTLASFNLT